MVLESKMDGGLQCPSEELEVGQEGDHLVRSHPQLSHGGPFWQYHWPVRGSGAPRLEQMSIARYWEV